MAFTNAQRLAAVLSDWLRPAASQIICEKLANVPLIQSMQQGIMETGLVGCNYHITSEIRPFLNNAINIMVEPMLEQYLSKLPDETIPALAQSVLTTAMEQPTFSILDGLLTFEEADMLELKEMVEKNLLPCDVNEKYQVIK